MIDDDEPLTPVRMLTQYAYCPRLAYLEWVQKEWADNYYTEDGHFTHRRVDAYTEAVEAPTTRALQLNAPNEGLVTKLDVLEQRAGEGIPVEYKRGRTPREGPRPSDRVQLCAQALVLRENGWTCDKGYMYYSDSRDRCEVLIDDELVASTRELHQEMRTRFAAGHIPEPLVNDKRCFQSESLAQARVHPKDEVAHPLVNLVQVLRELVALPQALVIHLQRATEILTSRDGEAMAFDMRFHYELNNAMRAGPILKAWREQPARGLGRISREIRKRLEATTDLIDRLRATIEGRLFACPRRFLFPSFGRFQHARLSQLEFVIRYETFMRALEVREARARPLIERLRSGTSITLEKGSDATWHVKSELDSSRFDDQRGFFNFLLAPVGSAGERAQMGYDDHRNRSAREIHSPILRLARVLAEPVIDPETGKVRSLQLELRPDDQVAEGARYHLHARYTDVNSDKQVARLRELDTDPQSLLIRLLESPQSLPSPRRPLQARPLPQLTRSQQDAWRQVCRGSLTLIWGPPGTGKTHFLAAAISELRRQTPPLQVVVTAFTHSAIEHLLEKIAEADPSRDVFKLQDLRKPSSRVKELWPQRARRESPDAVMGATVYGLARAVQAGLAADVLVVDEGSQMKWGELSLALDVLKPGGRLIIAGDDLQLPPIMAGRYPPPEDGLPGLEDSIFAYLRARDNPAAPYTQQLTENWRMHQRLSDFAATTLYGAAYRPATPEVASRRLSVPPSSHPLWPLLDPDYPLTLCILEDVQAAQENLVEAELVAGLATLLREQTPPEIDDTTFWKESLFIVSPHHLQIRAIRKELSRLRHWGSSPFVDTVDKMQGQEAQTVIVSYGVSDRETALQEAGFIYSLNRLNVSITRAQAKCVVFLPRPLLQPSFDVLDDDKAALGLGHMNALLRYCQTHGHEVRLKGGPRMTLWRA